MKKFISIFTGKIFIFLGKLLNRGSAIPGKAAYILNKNILSDFILPQKIIAVTGSSGKGSTSKIIAEVYKNLGYKVAYNSKGSNERNAIITTLIENCTLKGKVNTDICVFEMDERYAKYVFPYIKPSHVIVTNITRDQPPRQRNCEFILNEILKAIDYNVHLILNGDDPYLRYFNLNDKYNVSYYGIERQQYSYTNNLFDPLNIYLCPICNAKLKYNYYHIESLGDYYCEKCSFKRPVINYAVTNCDYTSNSIVINKLHTIYLSNTLLFNIYNVAAAFAYLSLSGLNEDDTAKCICEIAMDQKLYMHFKKDQQDIHILSCKAENASTYNQAILFAMRSKKEKIIVLGWKEISRRYKHFDISWLYDISFELLKEAEVKEIICAGDQRYDIAARLKYAEIDTNKIKVFKDLQEAKQSILSSDTDIYAILNFDYVEPFKAILGDNI